MDMVERVPISGCSSLNETSTEGFPLIYVNEIYIPHEEKVPRSTSTSPLKFHEAGPREKEEEEAHLAEHHFIIGSLNMSE